MCNLFAVVILSILLVGCQANQGDQAILESVPMDSGQLKAEAKTVLSGIQSRIDRALETATQAKKQDPLMKMSDKLFRLEQKEPAAQQLIVYWQAYFLYNQAQYYLIADQKVKARKDVEKAIKLLKNLPQKGAETYVLLALMQNFSIYFKAGPLAGIVSKKVQKNLKIAFKLDSANYRAYLVEALTDFYTPKDFGGGKKVIPNLKKAQKLIQEGVADQYMPTWGQNLIYELFIRYYLREENKTLAQKYFQEAQKRFPNDYSINELAATFTKK